MIASTLLFFLGTHIAIAVVARALQGVSAALVWVSGLSFLTSHAEARNLGWVMGMTSVALGAGELLGPVVGGVMYEHAGHFAVLGLLCAILGVDMGLRIMLTDKFPEQGADTSPNEDEEARPLLQDRPEEPQTDQQRWKEPPTTRKSERPATITLFGIGFDRDLCAGCYAIFINGVIVFAFETTLPIFVSRQFEWTTSASGGIIFAFGCPTLLSPAIASFTMKHGPRWASVVAFFISGAALIGLGFLIGESKIIQALFVIAVAVVGACACALHAIYNVAFSVAAKRSEEHAKREGTGSAGTGKSFASLNTAWAAALCVGPLAADVVSEHMGWLGLCIFLAALSFVSAFIMSMTWREWEQPEDGACEGLCNYAAQVSRAELRAEQVLF
ncbi:MAG: hypothetical protein M1836_006122 [Candelina mexicana]|nr:MAG: hypothetical protein M1836_006122 [Candelina mexicana]